MEEVDSRVRSVESDIDRYFEERVPVRDLYRPAVLECLLDRAELIVTGHRTSAHAHAQALGALSHDVLIGLNTALHAAARLCSLNRERVPDDLDSITMDSLALGMAYGTMEDAFFSYWKRVATASFPSSRVLQFTPKGTSFDRRLRAHRSSDDTDPYRAALDDPLEPSGRLGEEFVRALTATGKVEREGGFGYVMPESLIASAADYYYDLIAASIGVPLNLSLGTFTLSDVIRGWAIMLAVSRIHHLVSIMVAMDPTDLGTSVNWPVLYRKREEWFRWFSSVCHGGEVIAALTFDFLDKRADISTTPIVRLDEKYLGIAPGLILIADVQRRIMALVARKYQESYSQHSLSKEDVLLREFTSRFRDLVVGTKIRLPEYEGKQLPDIDLLLADQTREIVVVTEIKWQLSAVDTREVIARNEYLKKGQEQLSRIRHFLKNNRRYLVDRGILAGEPRDADLRYLLLCKGHLGDESVMITEHVMADYDVFVRYLAESGLQDAVDRVSRYDYLPEEGRDFMLEDSSTRFGEWRVRWKRFLPTALPPDDETPVLEDLYRRFGVYL